MINIAFEDFKKLALENNKRIYYYRRESYMELYFVTEGVFTKTVLDLESIESIELFFGQKMFFGAIQLNVPVKDGNDSFVSSSTPQHEPALLKMMEPKEADGGEDIQKESVEQ